MSAIICRILKILDCFVVASALFRYGHPKVKTEAGGENS